MRSEIPEDETLARENMANERTLLSWIRTGVNAIGIGILLYSAVLVLDVLAGGRSGEVSRLPPFAPDEFSLLGIGLIVLGILLQLAAIARFLRFRSSMSRGVFTSSALVLLLLVLAIVLLGVAFIVYEVIS